MRPLIAAIAAPKLTVLPVFARHNWNTMEISVRKDKISVKINGKVVAEHAGDPARPKVGPIGLQLHDQFSIILFRNVRVREY